MSPSSRPLWFAPSEVPNGADDETGWGWFRAEKPALSEEDAAVVVWVTGDPARPLQKVDLSDWLNLDLAAIQAVWSVAAPATPGDPAYWRYLAEAAAAGRLTVAFTHLAATEPLPAAWMNAWAHWQNATVREALSGDHGVLQASVARQVATLEAHLTDSPHAAAAQEALANFQPGQPLPALAGPGIDFTADQTWTLDIFDTCLLRRVARPVDAFALLASLNPDWSGAAQLAEARVQAEQEARQKQQATGQAEDVALAEIYAELQAILDWSAEQAAAWQAAEMALEDQLLYAHAAIKAWVQTQPAPAAYLSEMYLPSATLAAWLRARGFPEALVLTSGEAGLSKGSGRLYQHFAQQKAVSPAACWHVGDNPASDGEAARAAGWQSAVVPSNARPLCWADQAGELPATLSPLDSLCWGLAREAASRTEAVDYRWRAGWEILGPLTLTWLHDLAQRVRAQSVREVFFLGRDGFYLQQVWTRLRAAWGEADLPPGSYLYASRALLNRAAMTDLQARDWDFLLHSSPGLTVGQMLQRAWLDPEACAATVAANGLPGIAEPLADGRGEWLNLAWRDAMYHVFVAHIEAFHAAREAHCATTLAYLEEAGALADGVAFVDLGWHGTSFESLARIRRVGKPEASAHGFLWASWATARAAHPQLSWESYWIERGQQTNRTASLQPNVAALEMLLGAPHATVDAMRQDEAGNWAPVCADEPELTANQAFREAVWAGSDAFLTTALSILSRPVAGGSSAYLEAALRRWLASPVRAETTAWEGLVHREGWGQAARPLPFMPADGEAFSPQDWAAAPWKAGYLTRVKG